MRKLFLILSVVTLVVVAGLLAYVELFADKTRRFATPLAEVVPAQLPGWHVEDVPLAQTEGMLEHVNSVLQFDDSVQRVFVKDGLQVLVYAAYWGPGKVTTADAGTHNPDSCWVNGGMVRTERMYGVEDKFDGVTVLPYEYGVYVNKTQPIYVLFWHLVQGEPQRYEEQKEGWRNGLAGRIERLPLVLADVRRYGLNQKREQLFIRISANRPLDMLREDPRFAEVLSAVKGLGVFANATWSEPVAQ